MDEVANIQRYIIVFAFILNPSSVDTTLKVLDDWACVGWGLFIYIGRRQFRILIL